MYPKPNGPKCCGERPVDDGADETLPEFGPDRDEGAGLEDVPQTETRRNAFTCRPNTRVGRERVIAAHLVVRARHTSRSDGSIGEQDVVSRIARDLGVMARRIRLAESTP